jgi:hypothetical protein
MWKLKLGFDNAFQYVKQKRPRVLPNDGFRAQLFRWEKQLLGEKIEGKEAPQEQQEGKTNSLEDGAKKSVQ